MRQLFCMIVHKKTRMKGKESALVFARVKEQTRRVLRLLASRFALKS